MIKTKRLITFVVFGFMASVQALPAHGFQYGQCLLSRTDSFNNELREYRNVAFAKAAIKKLAFEKDPDLLKWNYDTANLIYDLTVLQADLIRLNNVYGVIRKKSQKNIALIQDFFEDPSGHVALAQVDSDTTDGNDKSVTDLIDLLEKLAGQDENAQHDISLLRKSFEDDSIKDALGDLYDRIQEASVGATPVEPETIEQWIALAGLFQGHIAPQDCAACLQAEKEFNQVVVEWSHATSFPDQEDFKVLSDRLPPLKKIKYPNLPAKFKEARKVVDYHYMRTMEEFLFSRAGISPDQVSDWVKKDPNYKIILKQANQVEYLRSETNPAVKLYRYILSKERVLGNAFDHFVWGGQDGTEVEKTIDGVARTLYGEAESCQISGASQFEAIGSIIAARSVSVDQENQQNNIFLNLANFGITVINTLPLVDVGPLISYKSGASDFGRTREMVVNPIISTMATPAQVVSRPGQFSVWKLGKVESLEISRWISLPPKLGYPKNLMTSVSGPVGSDMDPAQRKVLCPNNEVFKEAVKVATELVNDPAAYANKYRFYRNGSRVVPYFYTHGARVSLSFVRQILPKPSFTSDMRPMQIYEGSSACVNFKVYQPKYFKVSSKVTGKRKKSRGRR